MLEVLNHKYTDISETNFGASILNDSKYGILVDGTAAAPTLLKGGLHPDTRGMRGCMPLLTPCCPTARFQPKALPAPPMS